MILFIYHFSMLDMLHCAEQHKCKNVKKKTKNPKQKKNKQKNKKTHQPTNA